MIDNKEIIENIKEEVQEKAQSIDLKKALHLNNPKKGIFDAVQEKVISRKLLVFICATALLASAQLDPETWGMIAMMYIGGQTAVDFAKMWRHGG
jgi:hypothetical protein